MKFSERPPSPKRTYGYHRVEILAAMTNGLVLLCVAGYILLEAWQRFSNPTPVAGVPVLVVATLGLAVNVTGALLLHSGSQSNLNMRGAYNEVLADAASSVGVIAGAAVMTLTGWYWVDPVVAILIAIFILPRTLTLLREAVQVLLEGTPRGRVDGRGRDAKTAGATGPSIRAARYGGGRSSAAACRLGPGGVGRRGRVGRGRARQPGAALLGIRPP